VGLFLYAFAYATNSPVMVAAVQRYSTPRSRAVAFSLYYVSFNIGGTLSGPIVDAIRKAFLDPATRKLVPRVVDLPLLGPRPMTAHAAVLAIGALTSLLAFVVVLFARAGAERRGLSAAEASAPKKSPWALFRAVAAEKLFWRFLVLMLLLSVVRLILQHMHFTWPKYVLRVEGDDFPAGRVWALNSLLILFLTPLATVVTRRMRTLDAIIVGTFITAASPFLLCFGSSLPWQLAMVVTLTVGEAVWSPRMFQYNLAIAPRGQESTYVGLASFPFFMAKFLAARTSGRLLEHFCPAVGDRHPAMLWAVIGLSTVIGPVGIVLLRRVIERVPGGSVAIHCATR